MNKAIFLDRDGTINVERCYLHKIEDFEFIPGVLETLKGFQNAGYLLIVITNQSGIGRGYYTEKDFFILNKWMVERFEEYGIKISQVYFCPHLPNAKIEKYRMVCTCRKPALGMYERAIKEFNIDLSESYSIGDKIRDCAICEKTECKGFLIGINEKKEIIDRVKNGKMKNIEYAADLSEVAKKILTESGGLRR